MPTIAVTQAVATTRRASGRASPCGHEEEEERHRSRECHVPTSTRSCASQWTTPSAPSGVAGGGLGGGAAGTPTPNVKLPETGWPSSETTCHTTR